MIRRLSHFERKDLRFLVASLLIGAVFVWGAVRYRAERKWENTPDFQFPTATLAALDADLQARFAVIPDKDFGIERTYGNQHYLYDPQTPREKATVATLKKQKTEAAFYLMSRALWLRHWDGWGYKPIQGPVLLTGKLQSPLPRLINFFPRDDKKLTAKVLDQETAYGPDPRVALPAHNPDGTPVPGWTPPAGAPGVNQIQELGNRVFEMAEAAPKTKKIGVSQPMGANWKVVAVPIRASNKACLNCHFYQSNIVVNGQRTSTKAKLGDALGVAFYLYRQLESSPTSKTPARTKNTINPN